MGFDRCAFHCSTRHSNSANDKRRQRFIGMDADVSQFLLKLYRAGRDSVREFSGLMPHLIEAHRNSRLLQLRLLVSAAQAEQRRTTLRTVRAAALHQYRADILRIGPRRASALTPTVSAGRQLSREAAHRFQLALCEGRCQQNGPDKGPGQRCSLRVRAAQLDWIKSQSKRRRSLARFWSLPRTHHTWGHSRARAIAVVGRDGQAPMQWKGTSTAYGAPCSPSR